MSALQTKLADHYHTTLKPDCSLRFDGHFTLVGLDLEESQMPSGRFIWYAIDHPQNEGTVLRGETFCSWSVSTLDAIKQEAIKHATRRLGSEVRAIRQVNACIRAGGFILP